MRDLPRPGAVTPAATTANGGPDAADCIGAAPARLKHRADTAQRVEAIGPDLRTVRSGATATHATDAFVSRAACRISLPARRANRASSRDRSRHHQTRRDMPSRSTLTST